MPAALIILFALICTSSLDEVINLVRITTMKIRSDLVQSKACVSVGDGAAKEL